MKKGWWSAAWPVVGGIVGAILLCWWISGLDRVFVRNEAQCEQNTINARENFITTCIANSNPTAEEDSDPDDTVEACQQSAERLYCSEVKMFYHGNGITGRYTAPRACTEARSDEELVICGLRSYE